MHQACLVNLILYLLKFPQENHLLLFLDNSKNCDRSQKINDE